MIKFMIILYLTKIKGLHCSWKQNNHESSKLSNNVFENVSTVFVINLLVTTFFGTSYRKTMEIWLSYFSRTLSDVTHWGYGTTIHESTTIMMDVPMTWRSAESRYIKGQSSLQHSKTTINEWWYDLCRHSMTI